MAEPSPTYSNPAANAANAIALPIFAVLSSLVITLPFRSFYVLRSFPACSLCISVWIINLGTFLNAVLWPTDDWTKWWAGYGLCDIESILRWPITLASVTSLTCFTKGLADALDTDSAILNPTKAQRRRKLYFEILLCWGPPVLQAALHYIVQAGRYAIVPVFGCTDEVDNSWPYIVILISWAPIFTLLTCYYSGMFSYLIFTRHFKHLAKRKTFSSSPHPPKATSQDHLRRPTLDRLWHGPPQIRQASHDSRYCPHNLLSCPGPLHLPLLPARLGPLLLVPRP
jgi:pheromone a factor receptor